MKAWGWAAGSFGLVEKPRGVTVRDYFSEVIMIAVVVVIGGAVSLTIVTAFLLITGQHTWLDNF
jgi:hypothetical protein